ncbi:MAG: hypothetical protein KatS3mg111_2488 [Pirellulaceae bacterium]|nr:MAG: hypothetical protein KatS3mg111_2488 [Pirellulaceae bacterium]
MTKQPTDEEKIQQLDLALEHVFRGIDQRLIQRLKEEASSEQSRRLLVEAAGIDDPRLIDELADLGVTVYGLVALRLVPLVLVAWAEDAVDIQERQAILDTARSFGIREGSVADALLDYWIRVRPTRELLDAWKRLIERELRQLSPRGRRHFIELTRQQMEQVAKASGGRWGLGKISPAEQRMIDGLLYIMNKVAKQ